MMMIEAVMIVTQKMLVTSMVMGDDYSRDGEDKEDVYYEEDRDKGKMMLAKAMIREKIVMLAKTVKTQAMMTTRSMSIMKETIVIMAKIMIMTKKTVK